MKIRMLEHRTGPRHDGRDWPGYGGEIEVGNEEGRALCAQGSAIPVPEEKRAETPEQPLKASEEQRAGEDGKPAVNDPKAAWVAYAARRGVAAADAEQMTKEQLIKRYGG